MNRLVKGPILSLKKIIPGVCTRNQCVIILSLIKINPAVKTWNSICNRWYRTPDLSGEAQFSAACACVYNQEKMSTFIHTAEYILSLETFLCKSNFPYLSETFKP